MISPLDFQNVVAVTISTIRLTENDDSEAYDSILHCIGHYLGRNRVKKGFHRYRSKMSF